MQFTAPKRARAELTLGSAPPPRESAGYTPRHWGRLEVQQKPIERARVMIEFLEKRRKQEQGALIFNFSP
jgi:hypothetical protein